MEASPAQLIEFFNGFKQSVIPLFQRPYEWKQREWEALWQDILERYQAEKDFSHFMGAIVTMPAKSVPVGVSKYMVIDGQQRLTTLSLLLCAIRDALPSEARQYRNRIQNHYLTNDGYEDWEYLKVLPTQSDRTDFRLLVLSQSPDESSNIFAAYRYFRKQLGGKDGDGESIDPKRVLETLERRLAVVSINLGESDDPYLIFESLNFKGSPLTQADLVRNYFLMRFPVSDQQRIYDEIWLPMQQRLGAHLTEFIRQFLMREGEEVLKGEIYAVLKKGLAELEGSAVEERLIVMNIFSVYYLMLVQPEHEPLPTLRSRLSRLVRWELATCNPLLLRLYESHDKGTLSDKGIVEAVRVIESFAVRRAICEVPTNQLKKIFLQLAKGYREQDTVTWLRNELASGSHGARWPKDDEFKEAWSRYRAYSPSRIDRCKLILEAIEEQFGHKEPADLSSATVEHIMPVTLTDTWLDMLGNYAEEIHALYLHTIGNLTLTGYNPELSNSPFAEKKVRYAESHLELNKHFCELDTWSATEIQSRSDALWERARQIWVGPVDS